MDDSEKITQTQKDKLIKWFYGEKYRPFQREAVDYAKQQLGVVATSKAIAKILKNSSPPPGSKPQLWKSQFQAAGSSRGNKFASPVADSIGSDFGQRNAWQLLCDDGLVDPNVDQIPPSAAEAASASPARHVELNPHSTMNFHKKALTYADVSALLLHATGTISANTCDACLKNQGVFKGCVVQPPGGPCASKFNNSCSNCWFGGRANQCNLRRAPSIFHHRTSVVRDRKSTPVLRHKESSPSDENNNNRILAISADPKRPYPRESPERHQAKRRRTFPTTVQASEHHRSQGFQYNGDEAEDEDEEAVPRNRATSRRRETVSNGEEDLGSGSSSVLDPGDMTRYLNHYMKYYATMTKGERTRERVLRNLELVAIDTLNASGK